MYMTTLVESKQEYDAGSSIQKEPAEQALSLTELLNSQSGVRAERVYDTASLIEILFPPPTLGQAFFSQFMQCAQDEQVTLPDEPASVVVICTKSIATLGKKLGFSNDTTQKYVVLFKALGLLKKRNVMGERAFIISVGIYHAPETLEANLDHLILHSNNKKSRGKLHQLVLDVKERCLVYGLITQDITDTFILLNALLHPAPGETKLRLMRRFVQSQHLISTLATHVLQRTHHPQRQWVDSQLQVDSTKSTQQSMIPHIAPSTAQQVDFPDVESTLHVLPDSHEKQEFSSFQQLRNLPEEKSTYPEQTGRLIEATQPPCRNLPEEKSIYPEQTGRLTQGKLPAVQHQLDAIRHSQQPLVPDTAQNEAQSGRFSAISSLPASPETSEQVDSSMLQRNVNVSIYNYFITLTLRQPRKVAEFLAEQLEHDPSAYRKYIKLFSVQRGQPRDPHVLAAAFICTMMRVHCEQWKLERPGGYFTKICRIYDAGIPEDVEAWVKQYGAMSFSQFFTALAEQAQQHTQQIGKSTQVVSSVQENVSKPAPTSHLRQLSTAPQLQADPTHMVMNKDEAHALVECIRQDIHPRHVYIRLICAGKTQPRYAVLIDALASGSQTIDQLIVYTKQEWQERLASTTSWYNLFQHIKIT